MAKLRSLRQIHFVIATLLILTLASDKVALYGNVAFSFLVILILNVFFIRIEIFICSSTKFHPNWINSSYKTNLWRFYKLHILKEVHGRNVIYKNFHCQSLIFLFIWVIFFPYACIHFCAKATGIVALFFYQELPFLGFAHTRIFSLLFSC